MEDSEEETSAADSVAAFREEEVLPRVGNTVFSQIVFLIAFFVAFNPEKIITLHIAMFLLKEGLKFASVDRKRSFVG